MSRSNILTLALIALLTAACSGSTKYAFFEGEQAPLTFDIPAFMAPETGTCQAFDLDGGYVMSVAVLKGGWYSTQPGAVLVRCCSDNVMEQRQRCRARYIVRLENFTGVCALDTITLDCREK